MGLFDKLFGKKEEIQSDKPVDNSIHEEEWDFYFSNVDDIIGSFFLDLGLSKVAPLKDKPNLVWISLKMNNSREDGLSSNDELGKLSEIEDRLEVFFSSKHNSIYVGRLTSNYHRDFYFYFGDTTLYDKTISEAMVAFPAYTYDFGCKEDKDWESYFEFLYPNPRQFQSIQNSKVVDHLEENGDSLTKARQVDHWIYFETEKDREDFLRKIMNDGFQVVNKESDIDSPDISSFPFTLQIARVDKVDVDSVNDYVLNLWELAQECNGNYDGWETSVEKD
jgi:uncharacterized protein (TIGR01619 family)